MDQTEALRFRVLGKPMQKGSVVRMPRGQMIPAGTPASRKLMSDWRVSCQQAAHEAMGERLPWDGAVTLFVGFFLEYPRTTIRKYQHGWLPHTKQPDLDKLLRALNDAFTGIVWRDDSQITNIHASKAYNWHQQLGAFVHVEFVTNDQAKDESKF